MRISRVEIKSDKLSQLRTFYTKRLNLPIVSESDGSISLQVGRSEIEFSKSLTNRDPSYHFALTIPENKVKEACMWLSDRVDLLSNEGRIIIPFPSLNAHSMYFFDPDGNLIEFTARHDLNTESNATFSEQSLIGINEIGIPVKDVQRSTREISERIGVGPAVDDISEHSIVGIGDREGFLVIAPIGENWFMTDKLVEAHPIVVISAEVDTTFQHSTLPYSIQPP